jgi:hypothetical protein
METKEFAERSSTYLIGKVVATPPIERIKYLESVIGEYQDQVKSLEQKLALAVEVMEELVDILDDPGLDVNRDLDCFTCQPAREFLAKIKDQK